MQKRFAGQYAIIEANRTGTPQTVVQTCWDEWEFCKAGDPAAQGAHACVTWLPSYYLRSRHY